MRHRLPQTKEEWLMFFAVIVIIAFLIIIADKCKKVETAKVQIIKVKEESVIEQGQPHIKRSYKVDYNGITSNYITLNTNATPEQNNEYKQLNEGDWIEIKVETYRFPLKSIKMEFNKKVN